MQITKNKWLLFLVIFATVLLLVLVAVLTTLLVQNSILNNNIAELLNLVKEGEFKIEEYRQEGEYRETWEYIVKKAEELGMLTPDQILWINGN